MTASEREEREEEERLRAALAEASRPDGAVEAPGREFTAQAHRRTTRRRWALGGGLAVGAAAVASLVLSTVLGNSGTEAASSECVQQAATQLRGRSDDGYRILYGELREGRREIDDGVTRSSAFRFVVEGALSEGKGVPATGTLTVWFPTSAAELPEPGRYVMPLSRADRPERGGGALFHLAPAQTLPLDDAGRAVLTCGEGEEGTVERGRLQRLLVDR